MRSLLPALFPRSSLTFLRLFPVPDKSPISDSVLLFPCCIPLPYHPILRASNERGSLASRSLFSKSETASRFSKVAPLISILLSLPHNTLRTSTTHTHTLRMLAMDLATGLKRFGSVCPFISSSSIKSLSTTAAPRLASIAQNRCPLMGHALAQRGFSSSATCPISHQSSSSSANPSTGESSLLNKTKATAAGPSAATVQRGYASIAAVEAAALERATSPSSPQPSFVNPASIAPSAGLDGEDVRTAADQGHAQGRPTCALGFAKHVVTSHRPGFDFEAFYEAELDKKHKDKSYRVCSPSSM